MKRNLMVLGSLLTVFLMNSNAWASPWTLPEGHVFLTMDYDFQFATKEFLPDGTLQNYPLNGEFYSNTLRTQARYGFSDRFELGAEFQFKIVSFQADPIIVSIPNDTVDLPTARRSITDFTATEVGAGDVWLTSRYNLFRGAVLLTNETRLKLPTGYKEPQGTFDSDTGEVADDVTLGDGLASLEDSLLFGTFIRPIRTFARAEAGFRWRFGGPAPQVIGAAKAGTFVTDSILVYGGASAAISIGEGDALGTSFISTDPDLQPEDVEIGTNTIPVEIPFDQDWVQVEAGVLFVVNADAEVHVDYNQIVWGNNIALTHGVTIGVALRIPTMDEEE